MTTATMDLDVAAFRRQFPTLQDTVYLATCSLGARSTGLDAALALMLDAMASLHPAWAEFEEQVALARRQFAALIGARPEQIAVVPNASVGAYQIASTLGWQRRPKLVTTSAEFPSVAHVWLAQRPRGAKVVYVPEREGTVPLAGYLEAIDDRTALVSTPLVTYATGARLPVEEVAAAAHAAGARCFVDAYQAVGVQPVDVAELGCDYLVAGSMKYLLGLPGVAFLYVRDERAMDCTPQLTGWFGRVDPFAFNPYVLDFPEEARRLETGTPATPALYAANAGLDLIRGVDQHAAHAQVQALVAMTAERLEDQGERLGLRSGLEARGAHVAFADPDPVGLADWLARRRIIVSPRGELVRIAFHYYNTEADVDAVCDGIAAYRSLIGRRLPPARTPRDPAGAVGAVMAWSAGADPGTFPYEAVVGAYRSVGKHFVPVELLGALDGVRRIHSAQFRPPGAAPTVLERFLDTALDKHDGRYDYPTYLGLSLLDLPPADPCRRNTTCAERSCDRLLVELVSDALSFELAAAAGETSLLPELRPGPSLTAKRCRLGLRAIQPALRRQGVEAEPDSSDPTSDPVTEADRVCRVVEARLGEAERHRLLLGMLPVYVIHDEYLFIRVLQSFETTFSLIAVMLRAAAGALVEGDAEPALAWIERARSAQREAAPLFSLLATMQVEAFRTFRNFTEGASAIQSRNYKIVESLCRTPDQERLDSAAYMSVPEVRARVLAGQATLDDALERVVASRWLSESDHDALAGAMGRFAETLLRWRETHYRLAVRMLGEQRKGTGYTDGTPYLAAVRKIPVFTSLPGEQPGEQPADQPGGQQ